MSEKYVAVNIPHGITITTDEDGNVVFTSHEEPDVLCIRDTRPE